jgi:DnaJ-class molecular chaperone
MKTKKTCEKCKGSGIILLEKPIICQNCNGKVCYKCEYYGSCRKTEECFNCYGEGKK